MGNLTEASADSLSKETYRLAKGTIRISLGKDNTEEDIIAIASALKKILL